MPMLEMTDLDLGGQRVLIREDLNVPVEDGKVSSDARLLAALPTIRHALAAGAAVILLSHRGRPVEGETDPGLSLAPVAARLAGLLGHPVRLQRDWLDGFEIDPGEVVLCDNVRFNAGEKANDPTLAKQLAALCDVFVMDAFGTAHRAHASTCGVAQFAPVACAGPLLVGELTALGKALAAPARPMIAIVGGSKVSTKLQVLDTLADLVDQLIVGGGIANTFIAAAGHAVGESLYEPDMIEAARKLAAADSRAELPVPGDVAVAKEFSKDAAAVIRPVDQVAADELILDIGPQTAERYARSIQTAGTVVWNGPLGVFEFEQFGEGTRRVAEAIAESSAFSIAGGGDTLAAVEKYGIAERVSYISTGGGAFLEFLEGKQLPAVAVLEARAAS